MAKSNGYLICQNHLDSMDSSIRDRYKALHGFKIVSNGDCTWCKAEKAREIHRRYSVPEGYVPNFLGECKTEQEQYSIQETEIVDELSLL